MKFTEKNFRLSLLGGLLTVLLCAFSSTLGDTAQGAASSAGNPSTGPVVLQADGVAPAPAPTPLPPPKKQSTSSAS